MNNIDFKEFPIVFLNGEKYNGEAFFINGYNGYDKTEYDSVLCADGVNRENSYLKDENGNLIHSENRRGRVFNFKFGVKQEIPKGIVKGFIYPNEKVVLKAMKESNIKTIRMFITGYYNEDSNCTEFGYTINNVNSDVYYNYKVISKKTKKFSIK